MLVGLTVIILAVLVLPFLFKVIENNLEIFLFIMGISATLVSGSWIKAHHFNTGLLYNALHAPLMITCAVFIAGVLFKIFQHKIRAVVQRILKVIPVNFFFFILVMVLGLISSLITAIIASLILVEIVNTLELDRKQKIALNIITCFAIGLGAVLTPVGEPLATIAISKMGQSFWYLMKMLGVYIIPGIMALGIFAAVYIKTESRGSWENSQQGESYREVIERTVKVYFFVMALELLGEGFRPVIDLYLLRLNSGLLYWLNMISAVLDNATLTAAEISVKMSNAQIQNILMGLLISGGMLIPGNIPNIISAGKLKIGSKEWARLGVPLGLVIMIVYFVILRV